MPSSFGAIACLIHFMSKLKPTLKTLSSVTTGWVSFWQYHIELLAMQTPRRFAPDVTPSMQMNCHLSLPGRPGFDPWCLTDPFTRDRSYCFQPKSRFTSVLLAIFGFWDWREIAYSSGFNPCSDVKATILVEASLRFQHL
jgi:hypothetical protein